MLIAIYFCVKYESLYQTVRSKRHIKLSVLFGRIVLFFQSFKCFSVQTQFCNKVKSPAVTYEARLEYLRKTKNKCYLPVMSWLRDGVQMGCM